MKTSKPMSYISKQQTSWRNKKKVKKEKMTSVSTSSYPTPAKISSGTTITPEYHTVSACHVGNVSVAQIGKGSLLAGGWSRKASARDVAVIDLTATQYSRNGLGLVQGENNPASIAFKNTIDNAAETPFNASMSRGVSRSLESVVIMTWTSFLNPLGNRGLIGLSISLSVRMACVVGLPSRLKKLPGICPIA